MITIKSMIPRVTTVDRLISNFLEDDLSIGLERRGFDQIKMNMHEVADFFVVQVIAPGYEKDHFTIIMENDSLLIEAKIEQKEKPLLYKPIRQEYTAANFKKMIHVDRGLVDEPKEATYQNGILTIMLPKLRKEAPVRSQVHIN